MKYAILFLILGFLLDIAGVLFKVEHWPFADILILGGLALQAVGLFLVVRRLIFTKSTP